MKDKMKTESPRFLKRILQTLQHMNNMYGRFISSFGELLEVHLSFGPDSFG